MPVASRVIIDRVRLTLAALLALALTAATPTDPRLQRVQSFAFAIGQDRPDPQALGEYDLVIVDGQNTSARRVRKIQRHRTLVLGYLDVGTIERGRPWTRAARPFRLDRLEEWDEWYADVNDRRFRDLIARIATRLLHDRRYDGLFLDNTDMVETHRGQRRGMRRLVARLARHAHGKRRLLFAQNGDNSIGPLLRHLDGWNREDVSFTYDFDANRYAPQPPEATREAQRAIRRIAAKGLLVTATDYVEPGDTRDTNTAIENACAAGALPFVGDIGLTRLPEAPQRCPTAAR